MSTTASQAEYHTETNDLQGARFELNTSQAESMIWRWVAGDPGTLWRRLISGVVSPGAACQGKREATPMHREHRQGRRQEELTDTTTNNQGKAGRLPWYRSWQGDGAGVLFFWQTVETQSFQFFSNYSKSRKTLNLQVNWSETLAKMQPCLFFVNVPESYKSIITTKEPL